jgi:hypothetical protein
MAATTEPGSRVTSLGSEMDSGKFLEYVSLASEESSHDREHLSQFEAWRERRKPPMPEKRSQNVLVWCVGGVGGGGVSLIKVVPAGILEGSLEKREVPRGERGRAQRPVSASGAGQSKPGGGVVGGRFGRFLVEEWKCCIFIVWHMNLSFLSRSLVA